jgi:hypothetical protein
MPNGRLGVGRLGVPGLLVALGGACSSLGHQSGFQTEALPLAPGGPVEVGASVAAYDAGESFTLPGPDGTSPPGTRLVGTRATAHVRIPLTHGTSLRLAGGYAGVTGLRQPYDRTDTVSGIAGSVSVFHAFRPGDPSARWQGSMMWGGGVLVPQVPFEDLSSAAVVPGAHLGVIGSVALGPVLHWHAGTLGQLVLYGDGDGGVAVRGEGLLVTGPAWHVPVGRGGRSPRELQILLEGGFGWVTQGQTVYPAGQLTIATGPRRGLAARRHTEAEPDVAPGVDVDAGFDPDDDVDLGTEVPPGPDDELEIEP